MRRDRLRILKLRRGSCLPRFLPPRKRGEQALPSVVQRAYVCGVSTRKVDPLVQSPGPAHLALQGSRRLGVGAAETEAFWRAFLRGLVKGGLTGMQPATSDTPTTEVDDLPV